MQILQQIAFIIISVVSIFLFTRKVKEISRNIRLGRDENLNDNPFQRWRNLLLLAFGQKKMFRNPLVAVMHFFVYAGFIIINIEVLEIVLDGITGKHRLFAAPLGGLYTFLINAFEILALTVLIACVIFLIRRNIIKLKRFISKDLDGWPRSDANYILITEIVLMSLFLLLNASDTLLQARGVEHYAAHPTGNFIISQYLHPMINGMSNVGLQIIERGSWWLHIVGIFAFLNYLPYSKHLHIILAFPNAYYARLQPMGKMENMESIQKEVLYAMQPELAPTGEQAASPHKFGAKDVMDLSWKNLMDAYSCTECGRCSASCPANQTGKLLSPRKIMMDTRDRLEEVGKNININKEYKDDGKSLLHDYISVEELRACTTCNACVQECPVSISPLDIIVQLRRYLVMEESNSPQEWTAMFGNVENNFAPWKFSPDERDKWVEEMQ
ncbi:MAG TPA: (Fe-S)-binding protein [Chitinophagaceae bacterium]|nr:(Fe-S)-binding protein [Chitinophagaceae bacterium]